MEHVGGRQLLVGVAVWLAVSGRSVKVALQWQAPDGGVGQSPGSKCAEGGVLVEGEAVSVEVESWLCSR